MGRQSGQSSHGFKKPEPVRLNLQTAAKACRLVLFTSRLEPSPALGSRRLGSCHPWTQGSSLESCRLVDPCPSGLKRPRDSSPLVDPCSSRQEPPRDWLPRDSSPLDPSPDLGSSRLGLVAPRGLKDSSPLGSCTTLLQAPRQPPGREDRRPR